MAHNEEQSTPHQGRSMFFPESTKRASFSDHALSYIANDDIGYIECADPWDNCVSPSSSTKDREKILHNTDSQSVTLFTRLKKCLTLRASRSQISVGDHFSNVVDRILALLGGVCIDTTTFCLAHTPFTNAGRQQLRRTVLRSGPAYQLPSSHQKASPKTSQISGWRMGVVLNLALLLFCLLTELLMLIVLLSLDRKLTVTSIMYRGSCKIVKTWTSVLSLLVNILATLMISSSNYMMQGLSAPSDRELRKAHRNGRSLQLGVSSPFNTAYTSRSKPALWWIMGLSSIPIHLLFNSAFYSSLQTNNYAVAVMTSDAQDPSLWKNCTTSDTNSNTTQVVGPWTALVCELASNATQYEVLTPSDCVRRYSEPLINQYSNVILLSETASDARPALWKPHSPINATDGILSFTKTIRDPWMTRPDVQDNSYHDKALVDFKALVTIFNSFDYQAWKSRYLSNTGYSGYNLIDYSNWMCESYQKETCTQTRALESSKDGWDVTPWNVPIAGCLSQSSPVGDICQLESSKSILLVVIICDFVKMIIVIWSLRIKEPPLITIGDAVATFLKSPDPFTKNRCLMEKDEALFASRFFRRMRMDPVDDDGTVVDNWATLFEPYALPWSNPQRRGFHAATKLYWLLLAAAYLLIFAGAGALLGSSLVGIISTGAGQIWTRGVKSVDPNALFTSISREPTESNFVSQVMLVNTPQLFLSFLYFLYNGMLTMMHSSEEWSHFATQRKALRVSNPEPGQRSTYWLNLPWSYSIPLVLVSSILHWLTARGVYLVKIRVMGPDGNEQKSNSYLACGYSTLMILLALVILFLMACVLAGLSVRRLHGPIPLVGTASIAISAACYHPNDPETEARKPLLWGVTKLPNDDEPGHCSFSSGEVAKAVEGELYM